MKIRLSDTHWEHILIRAHLAGWVEARAIGLNAQQCDQIIDAAVNEVRAALEQGDREVKQKAPASPSRPSVDPIPDPGSEAPRSASERTRTVNPHGPG